MEIFSPAIQPPIEPTIPPTTAPAAVPIPGTTEPIAAPTAAPPFAPAQAPPIEAAATPPCLTAAFVPPSLYAFTTSRVTTAAATGFAILPTAFNVGATYPAPLETAPAAALPDCAADLAPLFTASFALCATSPALC